jgi:hypothetical protein
MSLRLEIAACSPSHGSTPPRAALRALSARSSPLPLQMASCCFRRCHEVATTAATAPRYHTPLLGVRKQVRGRHSMLDGGMGIASIGQQLRGAGVASCLHRQIKEQMNKCKLCPKPQQVARVTDSPEGLSMVSSSLWAKWCAGCGTPLYLPGMACVARRGASLLVSQRAAVNSCGRGGRRPHAHCRRKRPSTDGIFTGGKAQIIGEGGGQRKARAVLAG